MSDMAESITSASKITGAEFPFVRVPMFELRGSQARLQTGSEMIGWVPFVTDAQQMEWSTFCTSNLDWYNESVNFTRSALKNEGKVYVNSPDAPFLNFIWTDGNETVPIIPSVPPGPFGPVWQSSPPPFSKTFINYDFLKIPPIKQMLSTFMFLREGLMTAVLPAEPSVRFASLFTTLEDHEALHLQYVRDVYNGSTFFHPHSLHLQPVHKELNNRDSDIVGVLYSAIVWDAFMSNLLPEGVTGIVAVLHNTCDDINTYFLDGNEVWESILRQK
jgi:hypothetical protein